MWFKPKKLESCCAAVLKKCPSCGLEFKGEIHARCPRCNSLMPHQGCQGCKH